ncbi:hypothetical protein ASZ78_014070 [Callipepla squamata]|uniref:Leucine zipper with capping helix domain-containing protein n=1 Tax=Callipepla squamata TaxID=9009 RepID=A0A226MIY5_CALSU|nr:hypothetical protein ASZ78_014070 [Callipepla squamata]
MEAGECGPCPMRRACCGAAADRRCPPELKDLNGAMTTQDMAREIEELRKDCAAYAEKLERVKSATNHITPEEKEKVCSEQKLYCKEWRRRKRMATELLDAILEGYPKSKKQFFVSPTTSACIPGQLCQRAAVLLQQHFVLEQEEVGIETDEDHNVTPPAAV